MRAAILLILAAAFTHAVQGIPQVQEEPKTPSSAATNTTILQEKPTKTTVKHTNSSTVENVMDEMSADKRWVRICFA
jgi:ABC-type phosphate transport system substrate-binding protein